MLTRRHKSFIGTVPTSLFYGLEEAVRMLTFEPALAWGFADRGLVREGLQADLNVFDPATVAPAGTWSSSSTKIAPLARRSPIAARSGRLRRGCGILATARR